jgi:hypothetical protein
MFLKVLYTSNREKTIQQLCAFCCSFADPAYDLWGILLIHAADIFQKDYKHSVITISPDSCGMIGFWLRLRECRLALDLIMCPCNLHKLARCHSIAHVSIMKPCFSKLSIGQQPMGPPLVWKHGQNLALGRHTTQYINTQYMSRSKCSIRIELCWLYTYVVFDTAPLVEELHWLYCTLLLCNRSYNTSVQSKVITQHILNLLGHIFTAKLIDHTFIPVVPA